MTLPPLVLTMGEPAGIGGELTLAAWLRRERVPVFAALDDPDRLRDLAEALGFDIPIASIARPADAHAVWPEALPVLPLRLAAPVEPGRPDPRNAEAVVAAIARAVECVASNAAAAMVTNPIHKQVLAEAGFRHPGHTEFLGALADRHWPERAPFRPVMMLASDVLRVVPVTVHCSLRQAIERLSAAEIVAVGRIVAEALRQHLGGRNPRIAVAGLNPHAGEGGIFGREEIEIIGPAIEILRAHGIDAQGPLPPDTMFHAAARATYDVALCMYHDQALIPLKALDFAGGVNVTFGLPFIRTSPDHGTAFDIAGTGKADPSSLIAALVMAERLARGVVGGAEGGAEGGQNAG